MAKKAKTQIPPAAGGDRKTLIEHAEKMVQDLQALAKELKAKPSPARELEIGQTLDRVWSAIQPLGVQRVQRALVVHILVQEGDSLRVVEEQARVTGRPSAHDPVEHVRERLSILPGAHEVDDSTILEAVSACARTGRGKKDGGDLVKWEALAKLCVESGLGIVDSASLRSDYEKWKREQKPRG